MNAPGAVVLAAVGVAGALLVAGWLRVRALRARLAHLESRLESLLAERGAVDRLASAGRVAAGLAHELGNPLCAIANYAYSLERAVAPELRPTLVSLQAELSRIQRLTDSLVGFARPLEPGAPGADVNGALRESLRFLGDQGVLRRIMIDERLESAALPVKATALELEQLFANLLLNAAEAMPTGGQLALRTERLPRSAFVEGARRRAGDGPESVPPRRDHRAGRWFASHQASHVVNVVVADSGPGVGSGLEERVFEPFVTTRAAGHGTGLGLAIVRGIVDTMGGTVWVQRSREGGAAFHVVVPVYAGVSGPVH